MPSTIVSSNDIQVKGGGTGRCLDFTQNGVLWAALSDDANQEIRFYYSTDNGTNWIAVPSMTRADGSSASAVAIFIDKDDFLHVAYSTDAASTPLHYLRGTPNDARTLYTFGSAVPLTPPSQSGFAFLGFDIVAHREGSGWTAHVVQNANVSATTRVFWTRIDIDSDGGVGSPQYTELNNFGASATPVIAIDFRHEQNDPKAVQSSTPSLYVAYTNAGVNGVDFMKLAYSGGVWTPGTERTINAGATFSSVGAALGLAYDGTRILISYVLNATPTVVRVTERDEADTTNTVNDPTALADGNVNNMAIGYNAVGQDIWLFGAAQTSSDWKKIRYNRGGASWGSWITVDTDNSVTTPRVSMARGNDPTRFPLLGIVWENVEASPNNNKFDWVTAPWTGESTLQGVGSLTADAALGVAADANLQAVGTVSPTGNVGHGPTAALQGVGTIDAKGEVLPLLDFTVYDGYLDGLGDDGAWGLVYYDRDDARKATVSQQLRPPRQDTGNEPTEVRPETGEVFSQQDFSHGAGQLYFHHEGRDVKKYLWSEGFDVDIDTVGQPATLIHQHDVATSFLSSTAGRIAIFDDRPFVIDGTVVRKGDGLLPGVWSPEDPSGAEADVTPTDIVASGEFLYAALGVNGIHRRDTSGNWTHWSDVQATRVAWVKNRIVAAAGAAIYEVLSAGAAPVPIETLPAGWTFEAIFEVSSFIYATAVNVRSGLSRVHAYRLNDAGTALEKKSETPFPRDQLIYSGSGYLDNVMLGGGIKNDDEGFDPVVYQAVVTDQDTGALSYAKVSEGEGAGAIDLSVKAFESLGENMVFGWSLGSGFGFGARDGLALLKLKVNAFIPYLKKLGAGEGRAVESVAFYKGVLIFTLKGSGVYFEDASKVVPEAYLVSSVADWQTTSRKMWDLFQLSHVPHETGLVHLDYTTKLPEVGDWTRVHTHAAGDLEEVHENRVEDLFSRSLAVRIVSESNAQQTSAPEGHGFLVRSNVLPDNPEWSLVRFVRLIEKDRKDAGGEDVYIPDVQGRLRDIQMLAYRIVKLYEPGVVWTVRLDRMADMTPYLPRYWETDGEPEQEAVVLQLSLSGIRD